MKTLTTCSRSNLQRRHVDNKSLCAIVAAFATQQQVPGDRVSSSFFARHCAWNAEQNKTKSDQI
jgi:hypothetical protein